MGEKGPVRGREGDMSRRDFLDPRKWNLPKLEPVTERYSKKDERYIARARRVLGGEGGGGYSEPSKFVEIGGYVDISIGDGSIRITYEQHGRQNDPKQFYQGTFFVEGVFNLGKGLDHILNQYDQGIEKYPEITQLAKDIGLPIIYMDIRFSSSVHKNIFLGKILFRSFMGIMLLWKHINLKSLLSRRGFLIESLKLGASGYLLGPALGHSTLSSNNNDACYLIDKDPLYGVYIAKLRNKIWTAKITSPEFKEYKQSNLICGAFHCGVEADLRQASEDRSKFLEDFKAVWNIIRVLEFTIDTSSFYTSIVLEFDSSTNQWKGREVIHQDIKDALGL